MMSILRVSESLPSHVSRPAWPRPGSTSILEGGAGAGSDSYGETGHQGEDGDALAAEFHAILLDGQPDQVMDALLDPRFRGLVGSMSPSAFVEALHVLSPAYFIVPYRQIHHALHPWAVQVKRLRPLPAIFDEFAGNLAAILQIRHSAGHALGLAEYTHLLDCARSMGDATMAGEVWGMIREDGLVPDVQCYNHYMEAKVWEGLYLGKARYRTRMTPYLYRKRGFWTPNPGWEGYGTGRRSVRKSVLEIMDEMTREGTAGDVATFTNVILAASRVGHVQGMKNVLRSVWNIDVDVSLTSAPQATPYDRSSPLYPTNDLLHAIAHAFGTNNDIPTALRLIEFLSSRYGLAIPETVWLELFERAFVLCRPKFGEDAERRRKGQVSFDSVRNMFKTMTGAPFNVRPTIKVHQSLAKIAWDSCRLREFQNHMHAAYDILEQTRKQCRAARLVLEPYLGYAQRRKSRADPAELQSREFADAVHRYDVLRLRTAQETNTLESLAKLLLIRRRWADHDNPVWERRLLPRMLEEWQDFLPESTVCHTHGGIVQFRGRTFWGESSRTDTELDNEARLDDRYFWRRRLQSMPHIEMTSAPLKRLFGPVLRYHEAYEHEDVYDPAIEDPGHEYDESYEHDAADEPATFRGEGSGHTGKIPRPLAPKRQTYEPDDTFHTVPGAPSLV
ncbi:hypothetical protein BO70DRAFT_390528 [Aspergillus heteromorphus CBS 117.55]|uniref:Mitochondrial ATPase expression-domain-containing protein n=1 Tax=Aspergillus heteromorphus CBS 117.55 TaxID=1448321 RepID=A0A317V0I7_9EURO|nr:uncharacterized protein BO70DRAFT_390528 [Aspergillus heteromorphus CBS 117.55]PWY67179.1 hypothetical protein BO70DRAFT_390528 [Aspergillus heteromorphus CBS 117.55]